MLIVFRPFFDPTNENPDQVFVTTLQDNITLVDQNPKVGATVSASISSEIQFLLLQFLMEEKDIHLHLQFLYKLQ